MVGLRIRAGVVLGFGEALERAGRHPVGGLIRDDITFMPFSQSERMAAALVRFGKPVTLVKLQGDDHGLSKAPTRLEALQAVGSFLHQYLN